MSTIILSPFYVSMLLLAVVLLHLSSCCHAFTIIVATPTLSTPRSSTTTTTTTFSTTFPLFMFSGAGAGSALDDEGEMDPQALEQMKAQAAAMNMPLAEYQVGMKARDKLIQTLNNSRIAQGDASKIALERDANNPPKYLEITVTQAGQAMGADVVSTELCQLLKAGSDAARMQRTQAQRDMMVFVSEEMKRLGLGSSP
ncbi:hypothetical protein ACA910_011540 [Epithemia clementina (nom. ined.)]